MIAKNLIWISLVAFVLALAAQPAFSATLFVDAAAPPGGNGSSPAHAFTSLVDAVAAARVLPRQGALVIHPTAGTYPLPASKRSDGLLIDVPGLRLEGETQLSLDAAGVPQAVIGGATRITGVTGQALLRVRADEGVSLSGLILDGVDRASTSWTLVADGSPNFTMSKCVSYNAFFGVPVRSASATLEEEIFSLLLTFPLIEHRVGGPDKSSIPKRRLATRSLQARPMIAAGLRSKLPKGQV